MVPQSAIHLSVLVAFRNRELARVDRFLAGLASQTFRDFELIFLDYGSHPSLAAKLRARINPIPWAQYVFNETTGMPWNRAHALNSAARVARGRFLLFTDIDLIYSQDSLACLAKAANSDALLHAPFFLLPRNFFDWRSLESGRFTAARQSHPNTVGAIQLVASQIFHRVNGFDEFFRIWGVEDMDLSARLQRVGLRDERIIVPPIYHQWHPSSAVPLMPLGWLELMNFHSLMRFQREEGPSSNWGRCLSTRERPSLALKNNRRTAPTFAVPPRNPAFSDLAAWKKIEFLRAIIHNLRTAEIGSTIVLEINNQPNIRIKRVLANSLFRFLFRPLSDKRIFDPDEIRSIIWYIIIYSKLVSDYCIESTSENDIYILVKG